MAKHETLRAHAEACELRAARLSSEIATQLMRPSAERSPVTEALEDLARLRVEVEQLVMRLRSEIGLRGDKGLRRATLQQTTERYCKVMRSRLRMWERVVEAVRPCIADGDWPLTPPPRPRHDLGAAEEAVMSRVFTRAHHAINPVPQAAEAEALGCFADIPLNVGRFLANAHLARRLLMARRHKGPTRFLDVGCGGGVKVVLAAELFDEARGLEYDPGYVEAAGRTFAAMRAMRCGVVHADGLTYGGYGDFDVIYFYQPMQNVEQLHRLEEQIATTARPGTLLIAPYNNFIARAPELGCLPVRESVYVLGLPEGEVDALVAEVRHIGPDIVDPDSTIPSDAGWLRPLWLACQANGFNPA